MLDQVLRESVDDAVGWARSVVKMTVGSQSCLAHNRSWCGVTVQSTEGSEAGDVASVISSAESSNPRHHSFSGNVLLDQKRYLSHRDGRTNRILNRKGAASELCEHKKKDT